MKAIVGLVQGENRYDNISQVLDLIQDEIELNGRQQVLIKPNFVSTRRQLPSTHIDAIRAVLDFVRRQYDGPLIIAEGSAMANTWQAFTHFGLQALADQYEITLLDLNADDVIPVQVYDRHFRPQTLRMARTVVESDYRISVGPPKTHDTVIVTLSLKNMIMGALVNRRIANPHHQESSLVRRFKSRLHLGEMSDKMAMHQGYATINLNLGLLAAWAKPHLAVIDGFEAMEGAGPLDGDPVAWRVALAGTDALAVDSLTTTLMGFAPDEVGYLHYCQQLGIGVGEIDHIEVVGDVDITAVQRHFRPHPTYHQQRQWQVDQVEQWLQTAVQPA